jgi:hypothetical protein
MSKDYKIDMKTAMLEAEAVMGGSVAEVLEKTGAPAHGPRASGRPRSPRTVRARLEGVGDARRGCGRGLRKGTLRGGFDRGRRCPCLHWRRPRASGSPPNPCPPKHARIPAGIKPEEVDILITNCSIFCPTPSLASMLINKFKFRRDIEAYHLGGMGCSIGVVAVGLVRDMLKVGGQKACEAKWGQPCRRLLLRPAGSYKPACRRAAAKAIH